MVNYDHSHKWWGVDGSLDSLGSLGVWCHQIVGISTRRAIQKISDISIQFIGER